MKTKREYEEAFDLIDIFTSCGCNEVDDCNCCIAYNKRLKQQHGCELDLALNMFKELIEEHFEPKENTEEYKHFKLHSDSSLKNLTKVELIDYIKMLYHNWGISNDELRRHLYFIEPYNFEDLKVGMWILDRKPQYEEYTFIKIIKILSESDCEYLYHDKDKKIFFDNMECIAREFEENRFFPVQYANLIKMEVKK